MRAGYSGKSIFLLLFILLAAPAASAFGAPSAKDHGSPDEHEKGFDPGDFIFDHIGDSYDYHIFSIGEKHVSVPLPVILFSKNSGFHLFSSGKFHHGHASYRNFRIEHDGPNKGKIVEVLTGEQGEEAISIPLNMSITKNVFAMFFGIGLILWVFLSMAAQYRRKPFSPPKGIGAIMEPVILFVRDDIIKPAVGEKHYEEFLPYLLSLFFFIWINNMLGLIPFFPMGANVTGNISVAMGLAVFTFLIVNINGNKHYWQDIFNAPTVPTFLKLPIPLMPIIELVGMFTKPFVLMIRLFANITAGHIITMGFFSLIFIFGAMSPGFGFAISPISVLFGVFMTMLELLVALIQAYVFTLLTALYIGAAVSGGHE